MKKLNFRFAIAVLGLAVFILAASFGSVRVHAGPSSNGAVSGFCSDNDDFGRSHGDCVSIGEADVNALEQRGVTDSVELCKYLEHVFGPFPMGNCISRFASY